MNATSQSFIATIRHIMISDNPYHDAQVIKDCARYTMHANHYVEKSKETQKSIVDYRSQAQAIVDKWNEAWGSEIFAIVDYGITFVVSINGIVSPIS